MEIDIIGINETYIHVTGDRAIELELADKFTFDIPGAKWMPSVRRGQWDGKIKLYSLKTKLIYKGLLKEIINFCEKNNYSCNYDSNLLIENEFSLSEANQFINDLNLPYTPRDYQLNAFVYNIRNKRSIILSPTGSGKSLIIYMLSRYFENEKVLIIVPTTGLIRQLSSDFYSYNYAGEISQIFSGQEKEKLNNLTISTWQSIFKLNKDWFSQFSTIIVDECHLAKSSSISKIMEKCSHIKNRFGFTGTLDGQHCNELVLTGLFGPIKYATTTQKLIEEKYLADFKIQCIVLNYDEDTRAAMKNQEYQQEIDFIVQNEKRNKFIKNLALSLKGNTMVMFQFVEKQGIPLYNLIKDNTDRPVYLIHGQIDSETREQIRKDIDNNKDCILVASAQTTSTGINIKSLQNIIFASPSKARIRTLQAIGRVLRRTEEKQKAQLFDICDNLQYNKKKNYTLLHMLERIKIYKQEQFQYKIHNVELT